METTNQMLTVGNHIHNEIGYLFVIIAILIVFYILVSIEIQRNRVDKLKQAKELIERGHQKKVEAERRKNFEKSNDTHNNIPIESSHDRLR